MKLKHNQKTLTLPRIYTIVNTKNEKLDGGFIMIFWDFYPSSNIEDIVEIQKKLLIKKQNGDTNQYVLSTEHQPVFTYYHQNPKTNGRNDMRDLRVTSQEFFALGMPIKRYQRGGGITYHGPGQLTVYFILAPQEIGLEGPKMFTRIMENAIKIVLEEFHLKGYSLEELFKESIGESIVRKELRHIGILQEKDIESSPANGIWIRNNTSRIKKIASRGMRWHDFFHHPIVTFGFALNVYTNLYYFNKIIKPCGLDIIMTSIKEETNRALFDMRSISEYVARTFANIVSETVRYGIQEEQYEY